MAGATLNSLSDPAIIAIWRLCLQTHHFWEFRPLTPKFWKWLVMKREFRTFQNQKSRESFPPCNMKSLEATRKLAPRKCAQFNPYSGSISHFPGDCTTQLTAGFSAVHFSQFSPSLHDMFRNTYAAFLSNPMNVFVALQPIRMRSLDSNFNSMIIQSAIFKRSLEEGL